MPFRCIGCNALVPWDGKGSFSGKCTCGSHIIYNEDTHELALPTSLAAILHAGRSGGDIPHLDFLVGRADYTSPLKEAMIEVLTKRGAIWMKDCEQCRKDGTYQKALEKGKRNGEHSVS